MNLTPCTTCDWYRRVSHAGADCDMHRRLSTLAANLSAVALGCWSFHRGTVYGWASANVVCSQDSPDEWYPGRVLDERPCRGCGRRFVPTTEDFGPDWCGCEDGEGRRAS